MKYALIAALMLSAPALTYPSPYAQIVCPNDGSPLQNTYKTRWVYGHQQYLWCCGACQDCFWIDINPNGNAYP